MKELLFTGKLDLLFYNLIKIYKENETIWIKLLDEVGGFTVMAILFISLRGNAIKTKHSFTNTVHSWQVVALPLKSQLGGSFSMALGDIIHVLGRPRCGLCCVKKNVQFFVYLIWVCVYDFIWTFNSLHNKSNSEFKLKNPVWSKIQYVRVVHVLGNPHIENCF